MQRKVTLSIGHNVKGVPTLSHQTIVATTLETLDIEGATFFEVSGAWKDERETSTRVEIYCSRNDSKKIRQRLPVLARKLQQESIYFEVTLSNSNEIKATVAL